MKLALTKLMQSVRGLNTRILTESDFYSICEREKIKIILTPQIESGVYVVFDSESYIFINNKLRGIKFLKVAFHELAHYFLHFPSQTRFGAAFFDVHTKEKHHIEADLLVALALIPFDELENETHCKGLKSVHNLRKRIFLECNL